MTATVRAPGPVTAAPSPLAPPRVPIIEHTIGLPPLSPVRARPCPTLVASLLTMQRSGYPQSPSHFDLPRLSDEDEAWAVYWESQRVAAVTNSAADEANWQLHQIRIKRDALRAKGRVS